MGLELRHIKFTGLEKMIREIINLSFSDLDRIVLFSGSSPEKELRKAGTFGLSDTDFIETDFKYFQDKLRFTSPEILEYLGESDREVIKDGGIEKYLMTFFPTMISGDSDQGSISYYSTRIDSSGDETLCILIPEGIDCIEMFDGEELSVRVRFEGLEVEYSKVLYLITSYSSGDKVINLSYSAYRDDVGGNRSMSDYVLRNDSLVTERMGYQEKDGYIYSGISGSLAGTVKLDSRPLYDLIKKGDGEWWNRSKRYSIGDKVKVGDKEYESLEPNNIGNHPYYSRVWAIKD